MLKIIIMMLLFALAACSPAQEDPDEHILIMTTGVNYDRFCAAFLKPDTVNNYYELCEYECIPDNESSRRAFNYISKTIRSAKTVHYRGVPNDKREPFENFNSWMLIRHGEFSERGGYFLPGLVTSVNRAGYALVEMQAIENCPSECDSNEKLHCFIDPPAK